MEAGPKAHSSWRWGCPILGQLLAQIHCRNWLWVRLLAGKEQLVFGGKGPRGVITPAPEAVLLAHFSIPALLPELPSWYPLSTPSQLLSQFKGNLPKCTVHASWELGSAFRYDPMQNSYTCLVVPLSKGPTAGRLKTGQTPTSSSSRLSSVSLLMDLL